MRSGDRRGAHAQGQAGSSVVWLQPLQHGAVCAVNTNPQVSAAGLTGHSEMWRLKLVVCDKCGTSLMKQVFFKRMERLLGGPRSRARRAVRLPEGIPGQGSGRQQWKG